METSETKPAIHASDSQICEALWQRIGKKELAELPECLGFTPEINFVSERQISFTDSGVEVTVWLDANGRVAMLNVQRKP